MFESDTLPQANYAYLEYYDRYYFIMSITKEANSLHTLYLLDDVRMNHKDWFRQCEAILARQQYLYNLYQEDELISTYSDTWFVIKKLTPISSGADVFDNESNLPNGIPGANYAIVIN